MIRKIIYIEEKRCNGCGICAAACHEGAIEIVEGKARLAREHFCDGLGDCLPACPAGAITFEEREAPAYDEAAVQQAKQKRPEQDVQKSLEQTGRSEWKSPEQETERVERKSQEQTAAQVRNWPVQIKLAPLQAPYFQGARLLIAADCTAYAYREFSRTFAEGHMILIGCPKLDMVDYSSKLTEIIRNNAISEVLVVRMEVPCCGGLEMAVRKAMQGSRKEIPREVVTIATDGRILARNQG